MSNQTKPNPGPVEALRPTAHGDVGARDGWQNALLPSAAPPRWREQEHGLLSAPTGTKPQKQQDCRHRAPPSRAPAAASLEQNEHRGTGKHRTL